MSALEYFRGNDLAASVWKRKYASKGEKTPLDMHKRLAAEIARAAHNRDPSTTYNTYYYKYLHLIQDFEYIVPQGSIMSQLGSEDIGSLSNCFVVGQPKDSYGGIMQKDEQLAQLMKRRGGVGIDISTLRPSGVKTSNAAKSSTGAVSFMERYSSTTREVAQNGRRGALMISIDCNHPDLMDFIKIKSDLTKVTGANISIQFRDSFMKAVRDNKKYVLRFPCNTPLFPSDKKKIIAQDTEGELVHRFFRNGTEVYTKIVDARKVWDEFISHAHKMAEPGAMYLNAHLDYSPDSVYDMYKGVTANPCGEIYMSAYDACRLLILNLFSIVKDAYKDSAKVNYGLLYILAYEIQVLADLIVDLEVEHIEAIIHKIKSDPEPLEVRRTELRLWMKILKITRSGRRTGCGLTGLGDMLAALNLKYGSEEALVEVEKIMRTIFEAQLTASIDLAEQYGPFEGWDASKEFIVNRDQTLTGKNDFYDMICNEFPDLAKRMYEVGRRNVSWSTVAPGGSVSLLTETTSGIEPLFLPYYIKRNKVNPGEDNVKIDFTDQNGDNWQEFPVLHPKFKEWIELQNKSKEKNLYNLQDVNDVDKAFAISPWFGSTANDLDWNSRVAMQGIIQKYTTHSISSTVNLPEDVSVNTIHNIYMKAWERKLKGITVYRDNCRSGVLISTSKKKFNSSNAPKRDKVLPAKVHISKCLGEEFIIVVGMMEDKPYEVFAQTTKWILPDTHYEADIVKVKKGIYRLNIKDVYEIENFGETMTDEQATICRLVSTSLRHGAELKFVVEQLNKTPGTLKSFGKVLARTLKKYIPDGEKAQGVICQDCKSTDIIYEEGCQKCLNCGSSKCG